MVTIKDFEMPKHCGECIFHIDNYPYATHTCVLGSTETYGIYIEKPKDCRLKESN